MVAFLVSVVVLFHFLLLIQAIWWCWQLHFWPQLWFDYLLLAQAIWSRRLHSWCLLYCVISFSPFGSGNLVMSIVEFFASIVFFHFPVLVQTIWWCQWFVLASVVLCYFISSFWFRQSGDVDSCVLGVSSGSKNRFGRRQVCSRRILQDERRGDYSLK